VFSQVDEELLWELMVQSGPVVSVHIPKDPVSSLHRGFGFVEFRTELDAEYAIKVLNMVKLYGRSLRISKSAHDKESTDIGANLFVGNLGDEVDEKMLYDTFSAFGGIVETPHVVRDVDHGGSKGFGFVKYDSFEAADLAIECMNGQFLANRTISVQFAFRKDTPGERHGSQAERILAANSAGQRAKAGPSAASKLKPHTMFAAAPGEVTTVQSSQRMVGQARPSGAMGGGYNQAPPPMPGMGHMGGMPPQMGGMPPPSFGGGFYGGGHGSNMGYPPPLPSGAPPPMGMPHAPRPSNMPAWMSAGVAPAPGQNIPNAFGGGMPPPLPAGMPPPLPRQ